MKLLADPCGSLDVVAGPGESEEDPGYCKYFMIGLFLSKRISSDHTTVQVVNHVLGPYVETLDLEDVKNGIEKGAIDHTFNNRRQR